MNEVSSLLSATAAAFTALVFARAAWHKLADFTGFTGFVADYRLVPEAQVKAVSTGLVAAEVAIPLLLLVPATQAMGAVLAILLLGTYALAMGINILRGRTRVECGCGGAPTLLSPALLVRNAVLAAIAALVLVAAGRLQLSFGDAAAAVALGFMLWVAFLLAEQVISNGIRARMLRR
ncbi:MAG: methylamine utilization protein MauE [Bauldia sp.]|nr:methylamine utilization protein MauE [Bauldia sp.]